MKSSESAIIILAAGASSRMGSPKQLLPWGDSTLLQNAILQAKSSHINEVVVVLGANAGTIRSTIPQSIATVENKDWKNGMGSSIAAGVQYVLKSESNYASMLIMLGDQPLIDSAYIDQMLLASSTGIKKIIATSYKNRAGVPALFSATYFKRLQLLNTDFGAKELLAENIHDVFLLHAGTKTMDIDTNEDYRKLNNKDNLKN